jgi:hypothetical protein
MMINDSQLIEDSLTKQWYKRSWLHRLDGPAYEHINGEKVWYFEGKFHCETGPAIIRSNGDLEWYRYGLRHREDGPALILKNGIKKYYLNDKEESNIDNYESNVFLIKKRRLQEELLLNLEKNLKEKEDNVKKHKI